MKQFVFSIFFILLLVTSIICKIYISGSNFGIGIKKTISAEMPIKFIDKEENLLFILNENLDPILFGKIDGQLISLKR